MNISHAKNIHITEASQLDEFYQDIDTLYIGHGIINVNDYLDNSHIESIYSKSNQNKPTTIMKPQDSAPSLQGSYHYFGNNRYLLYTSAKPPLIRLGFVKRLSRNHFTLKI